MSAVSTQAAPCGLSRGFAAVVLVCQQLQVETSPQSDAPEVSLVISKSEVGICGVRKKEKNGKERKRESQWGSGWWPRAVCRVLRSVTHESA